MEAEDDRCLHQLSCEKTEDTIDYLKVGDQYDVLDSSNRWCEAEIVKIDRTLNRIYVSYIYWEAKFDDWVTNIRERLAPLHTHTYTEGRPIQVGQRVEVLDEVNCWCEAFVVEANEKEVKIHYKGYHPKFDEWINRELTSRFRPYGRTKKLSSKHHKEKQQWKIPNLLRKDETRNAMNMNMPGGGARLGKVPSSSSAFDQKSQKNHDNHVLLNQNWDYENVNNKIISKDKAMVSCNSDLKHDGDNGDGLLEEEEDGRLPVQQQYQQRTRRISELSEQYLQYIHALQQHGLAVSAVSGDGNCLFRAVSHQIYGDESYHMIVRQKCVDYMESEADFFCQFVEGGRDSFPYYLQAKRTDACWGDDPEIEAICELYDRPAEIWAYDPIEGAQKLRTFHENSHHTMTTTTTTTESNSNGSAYCSSSSPTTGSATTTTTGNHFPSRHLGCSSNGNSNVAPILRLSYYGGGHYDSIIDIHDSGNNQVIRKTPGEIEELNITRSRNRHRMLKQRQEMLLPSTSEDAAITASVERLSDEEATERAELELALQESRNHSITALYDDIDTCLTLSMQQYYQQQCNHTPISKEADDYCSSVVDDDKAETKTSSSSSSSSSSIDQTIFAATAASNISNNMSLPTTTSSSSSISNTTTTDDHQLSLLAAAHSVRELQMLRSAEEQSELEYIDKAILASSLSQQQQEQQQQAQEIEEALLLEAQRISAQEAMEKENVDMDLSLKYAAMSEEEAFELALQQSMMIPVVETKTSNISNTSTTFMDSVDKYLKCDTCPETAKDIISPAQQQLSTTCNSMYAAGRNVINNSGGSCMVNDSNSSASKSNSKWNYTPPPISNIRASNNNNVIIDDDEMLQMAIAASMEQQHHRYNHQLTPLPTVSVSNSNNVISAGGNYSNDYMLEDMDEELMRAIEASYRK